MRVCLRKPSLWSSRRANCKLERLLCVQFVTCGPNKAIRNSFEEPLEVALKQVITAKARPKYVEYLNDGGSRLTRSFPLALFATARMVDGCLHIMHDAPHLGLDYLCVWRYTTSSVTVLRLVVKSALVSKKKGLLGAASLLLTRVKFLQAPAAAAADPSNRLKCIVCSPCTCIMQA